MSCTETLGGMRVLPAIHDHSEVNGRQQDCGAEGQGLGRGLSCACKAPRRLLPHREQQRVGWSEERGQGLLSHSDNRQADWG